MSPELMSSYVYALAFLMLSCYRVLVFLCFPFLFLLTCGVWRSSLLISGKSAGAASTRGVLLSLEVLYRPAAASTALLSLLFVSLPSGLAFSCPFSVSSFC